MTSYKLTFRPYYVSNKKNRSWNKDVNDKNHPGNIKCVVIDLTAYLGTATTNDVLK